MAWTYAQLRAEVLARCEGMTDDDAAALLALDVLPGRRDVLPEDARRVLLSKGELAKAVILSRESVTETTSPERAALIGAAITLTEAVNPTQTKMLLLSEDSDWAATQTMLGTLVQAGVVSSESQAALLALATTQDCPWNPLPTAADIAAARAMEM